MQVFVKKSDLTASTTKDDILVLAMIEDGVELPRGTYGSDIAVLSLPPSAVVQSGMTGMSTLAPGWRNKFKTEAVGSESSKRILDVFPEHSQRNSMQELNSYVMQYGAESSKWPAAAQARKGEIDRCWNYVNAVRAAHKGMMAKAMAFDPTSDGQWPAKIAPYQPL
jgi:hypothetical protein